MSGKLYRAAPENVRDVSAVETQQIPKHETPFPVTQKGITQFRELLPQESPPGVDVMGTPIINADNDGVQTEIREMKIIHLLNRVLSSMVVQVFLVNNRIMSLK